MLSELARSRAVRAFAVVLVALAVVTTVGLYLDGGISVSLLEGLIFLYISIVLAYGVFRGVLDEPRVQIAFGVGVAVYGLLIYLLDGQLLWLAVGLGAAALTARNVLFLRE